MSSTRSYPLNVLWSCASKLLLIALTLTHLGCLIVSASPSASTSRSPALMAARKASSVGNLWRIRDFVSSAASRALWRSMARRRTWSLCAATPDLLSRRSCVRSSARTGVNCGRDDCQRSARWGRQICAQSMRNESHISCDSVGVELRTLGTDLPLCSQHCALLNHILQDAAPLRGLGD